MADQALGHLGISTQDIEEWSDFATRQLGLQLVVRMPSAFSGGTGHG
jgi:catechol-2,3-dioxygenase